jgi:hypothetical protein
MLPAMLTLVCANARFRKREKLSENSTFLIEKGAWF